MRRAVADDAAVLDKVWAQAGQKCPRNLSLSMVSGWLAAPGVFTYLVEKETAFGFVTVGPPADSWPGITEKAGEILAWSVLPEEQCRGVGRKLLVHGMSVLKRRHCESAFIWLSRENKRAVSIVTKAGFELADAEKVLNTSGGSISLKGFTRGLADYF